MEKIARDKLTELGLMTIQNINQAVETLSGGQRQGVAVARAAAFGSKVIILDEPTAALGVKESRKVLELILDVRSRGLPIVLISHNMPHVFEVADRIHIHRLGKRLCVINPKEYTMSDAVAFMTGAKVPPEAHRRMTMTLAAIADGVIEKAGNAPRFIVAIAGPPGAGKSTLADALHEELTRRGEKSAVLPMDGFHMDNGILEERGLLKRKGAPETFDVRGLPRYRRGRAPGGRGGSRAGLRPFARDRHRLGARRRAGHPLHPRRRQLSAARRGALDAARRHVRPVDLRRPVLRGAGGAPAAALGSLRPRCRRHRMEALRQRSAERQADHRQLPRRPISPSRFSKSA